MRQNLPREWVVTVHGMLGSEAGATSVTAGRVGAKPADAASRGSRVPFQLA